MSFSLDNTLLVMSYLSVNPGRCYSRADLAVLLYPDHDDRRASQNIRQVIHRLRKLLREDERNTPGLMVDNITICVNPDGKLVSDVHQFAAAYQAAKAFARTHSHRRPEICRSCKDQFEKLVALYSGDFLESFLPKTDSPLDDWVPETRQEFIKKICTVYDWLAKYYFEIRQYDACLRYLTNILKYDPFDEAAVRLSMRVFQMTGKRNQALLCFHDFQTRLQKTLNIGAEEETILLAQTIRMETRGQAAPTQPGAENALFRHQDIQHQTLPDVTLPFFNRASEIEQMVDLLESREHRIIVIKGVIGVGKTRLAMQVAQSVKSTWANDAHMVIINRHQHANLATAMVQALGIPSENSSEHRKNLIQYLRGKESLIILDNLDDLPDQSDLILSLTYQCPQIKFIITTHKHLGIRGEQVIPLSGLAYPRLADFPERPGAKECTALVNQYNALAFFREVALRSKPNFAIDEVNFNAVVDICEMLVGLPLAIELVAAYTRVFTCQQIRDGVYGCLHCDHEMAMFVAGRQGQFVKRFEAIWEALNQVERDLVKQVDAFADGVDANQLLDEKGFNFETLAGLLDKSALVTTHDQRVNLHPLMRFFVCP